MIGDALSEVGCVDPVVGSVYSVALKEADSGSIIMGVSSVPINSWGDAD